jgi:hypothetical protein
MILLEVATNPSFDFIYKVIVILLGAAGGIWGAYKIYMQYLEKIKLKREDIKYKNIDNQYRLEKDRLENEQYKEKTFQENIINKIFNEYVDQTKWITTQFNNNFEKLIVQLSEQEKLSEDIYASLDNFRREHRESIVILSNIQKDFDYKYKQLKTIEEEIFRLLEKKVEN